MKKHLYYNKMELLLLRKLEVFAYIINCISSVNMQRLLTHSVMILGVSSVQQTKSGLFHPCVICYVSMYIYKKVGYRGSLQCTLDHAIPEYKPETLQQDRPDRVEGALAVVEFVIHGLPLDYIRSRPSISSGP